MNRLISLGLFLTLAACTADPGEKVSIQTASELTKLYAKQELHANAAGSDCLVLLIRRNPLDSSTVESIHYGTDDFTAYAGGIQQFLEDKHFRAAVYEDRSDGLWTYGSISREEARSMTACP